LEVKAAPAQEVRAALPRPSIMDKENILPAHLPKVIFVLEYFYSRDLFRGSKHS
jgi:hypothetical protein